MNTKATNTNKPPQAHKAQRRERKKLRNIGPAYLRVDAVDRLGLEVCGQHHFEQFQILAVTQFAVADAWRLVHTRTRFQPNGTLSFVFKFDPTLEHIDQLELGVMQMRLT